MKDLRKRLLFNPQALGLRFSKPSMLGGVVD
jgi:hypothetical protein